MPLFEVIAELIFIDLLGGAITKANNMILRLRGIETRSKEQIEFDNQRIRYENKRVKAKHDFQQISKGSRGLVREMVDAQTCIVEFTNFDSIEMPTNELRILFERN